MASSLTSKGKAWEYRNSLWILWTLLTLGFLNYVSFFYISRKVKQKKWFRAGIVYSIFFILFALAEGAFTGIFIISWLVSIFHVFKIRTEYLLRLEAMQTSGFENSELNKLKETIAREYGRADTSYTTSNMKAEKRVPIASQEQSVKVESNKVNERTAKKQEIDINTALESEIAEVPGVGSIFASKIVMVRSQENGFKSFEHFIQTLSVKPHLAEKIKSHIVFSEIPPTEHQVKKTEGRIVDF
ncbi:hypothetical protein BBH88_04895 [Planococcus antarcticus DSM 14505]|uniref:Helix-hairpin-helix domain-containing protein n=1 Tax=Planococcus antarcticus DSM 14505 TaxID=1185653 RepID=A0ABN4RC75_9BACL|nr:helix-hairpin-helix domain-containing protein [Planococcus antarcticus]ANU09680.1 hypothetical protein BBH88_04895 [Planococcus antarcticus DSM 14505]